MNANQWFNQHGIHIVQRPDGWAWSTQRHPNAGGSKIKTYGEAETQIQAYLKNAAGTVAGKPGQQAGALTGADLLKGQPAAKATAPAGQLVTFQSALNLVLKSLEEAKIAAAEAKAAAAEAQGSANWAEKHANNAADHAVAVANVLAANAKPEA